MDFNVICRFCGETKEVLSSIFVSGDDQSQNETLDKIFYLGSLEPFQGDGLPEKICEVCEKQLEESYNFRKQMIMYEEKFKVMLTENLNIKTEEDDWDNLDNLEENFHETDTDLGKNEVKDELFDSEKDFEIIAGIDSCDEQIDDELIQKAIKRQNVFRKSNAKRKRICPECGMLIANGNFSDHMLVKHREGEPQFPCDICGAKLKTKRLVWAHKKAKHAEPEKINCDQCGMIFMTRNNFKKHYNTIHLDIRKHKCEICNKSFKFWKSYQSHVRSHTGERPYVCSYCNRGFSGAWALKQHVWLHTNEKPYKCQYCSEAFTQNVTLKLHIKRKHSGCISKSFDDSELKIL